MGQLSLALALINVGQNKPKQAKSCSVVIFIVAAVGVVAATAATSLKTPATLFQFGALTSLTKNFSISNIFKINLKIVSQFFIDVLNLVS